MGLELVEPDWPPLTPGEVKRALVRSGLPGAASARLSITWHSPRPFSAAGIVEMRSPGGADARSFVKRHHGLVRTVAELADEHRFSAHLAVHEVPVAAVVAGPVALGGFTYEAHEVLSGLDLYRDAPSWTPYRSTAHAGAAGRALARLHLAAAGYKEPSRPYAPLWASGEIAASPDPIERIEALAEERPGLGDFLARRPWRDELARRLLPFHERLVGRIEGVEPLWGHNDWHPSNLLWSKAGNEADVVGVIDFGLCNLTSAVYDLATAIERSVVGWLEPAERRTVHLDQMEAIVRGYASVRPLSVAEAATLPLLLPVVHLEYALSEVEYFHAVVGSESNAELAWDHYLLGHMDWFASPAGTRLAEALGCTTRT